MMIKPIEELSAADGNVMLIRRTGKDTIKTSIGWFSSKNSNGVAGWGLSSPPTHFCELIPFPSDKAGIIRQKLSGVKHD